MEIVVNVCIITLAVIVVAMLVLLGVLLYNQMLATNEVNKRLLLITKESIDKERSTQEELQQALIELDRATQENQSTTSSPDAGDVPDEEPFNPHTYGEDYKED